MKHCTKCNKDKDDSLFYSHSKWCIECKLAAQRRWNKNNSERILANTKRWRSNNKDRANSSQRESEHRKRALFYGVAIDKTVSIIKLFERDKGICGICKLECSWEAKSMDHKIPLSKGGNHTWDNVQLAHLHCNVHKGNSIEFRPEEDITE